MWSIALFFYRYLNTKVVALMRTTEKPVVNNNSKAFGEEVRVDRLHSRNEETILLRMSNIVLSVLLNNLCIALHKVPDQPLKHDTFATNALIILKFCLKKSASLTCQHVVDNPSIHWSWRNLTRLVDTDVIVQFINIPYWDFKSLSNNPRFINIAIQYPHLHWDWESLSSHANVCVPLEFVFANPTKNLNWRKLSLSVDFQLDYALAHPNLNWNWNVFVRRHKCFPTEFIIANQNKGWHYNVLSKHPKAFELYLLLNQGLNIEQNEEEEEVENDNEEEDEDDEDEDVANEDEEDEDDDDEDVANDDDEEDEDDEDVANEDVANEDVANEDDGEEKGDWDTEHILKTTPLCIILQNVHLKCVTELLKCKIKHKLQQYYYDCNMAFNMIYIMDLLNNNSTRKYTKKYYSALSIISNSFVVQHIIQYI